MSAREYAEGLLFFVPMLGGVLAGATLLLAKRLPHLRGAARVVAFGMLATLGLLAVHVAPGILGVLTRGTVLVASGLWVAAAWVVRPAEAAPEAPPPAEASADRPSWVLGAAAAAALVLYT